MPTKTPRELDNQEYKRQVMGLLLLPPERREEAVSSLLDLLKPNYVCKVCGEKFYDNESLYEHYDIEHNKGIF